MLHLAFADQLLHRARDVFDGHLRVDAVLVEKVDRIDLEPPERRLRHRADVLGPAVHGAGAELHAELGRDHDLAPDGRERLANQLFVRERTVRLGGVEEGDTMVDGRPDELDHLRAIRRCAVREAHAHAAQADGRDLQPALSKLTLLHRPLLRPTGPSLKE
jgi:hypothetical protein